MIELPPPQPYEWQNPPICYMIVNPGTMLNLNSLCGVHLTCSAFRSSQEAQAAFDSKEPGTEGLDGDNDGKVCEWGTHKGQR
ncbi:MAG: excalibur calcium-binding domain-containing protein [Microcystaceae cyanobacterium]